MTPAGQTGPPLPASAILDLLGDRNAGPIDASRMMVVVAHPDDETIGLGGQLARLCGIRILHVTDGAPADMRDALEHGFSLREDYAEARRLELAAAMELAGIGRERLSCLWIVDQETPFRMAEVALRLTELFRRENIAAVFTHTYDGGHPDHEAVGFAVHAAAHLLERAGSTPPALVEFPLYHLRDGQVIGQEFPRLPEYAGRELVLELDDERMQTKLKMLAAHVTQRRMLSSFRSTIERFRAAPRYDYASLPNGGELLYERYGWGLSGQAWLVQTQAAREELDLPPWL